MLSRSEIEALDLSGLADQLAQVRSTKTRDGYFTDKAMLKSTIERLIFDVVCAREPSADSSRIRCEQDIELEVARRRVEIDAADLCAGGILLNVERDAAIADGERAVLKIKTENDYPLRVKCVVRSRPGSRALSVAFDNLEGAEERRVQRLIVELLKHQVE